MIKHGGGTFKSEQECRNREEFGTRTPLQHLHHSVFGAVHETLMREKRSTVCGVGQKPKQEYRKTGGPCYVVLVFTSNHNKTANLLTAFIQCAVKHRHYGNKVKHMTSNSQQTAPVGELSTGSWSTRFTVSHNNYSKYTMV